MLTWDLSFVPTPRLSKDLLGLGRALPRDVPFGLIVALASRVLTGMVLEKLVLVALFGGAAWGAARLVEGRWGAVAAGVLYAVNPYTYERILLGQAVPLLGYVALPWVVHAALRLRRGERRAWASLALTLAAGAFTSPFGGVITAFVAIAVAGWPARRTRDGGSGGAGRPAALAAGLALVVNLPWLVPSLLRPGGIPSPAIAFDLFHARADAPVGTLGSLLSLGGLWRTDLAPPGRTSLAWVPAFVVIVAIGAAGWRSLRRRWPAGALRGIVAAAAIGIVLALGVRTPLVGPLIRWVGEHVPGGGMLRDGQKFMAPFALLLALAFGWGVEAIARGLAGRRARWVTGTALVLIGAALGPTLVWGASGLLFVSSYPPSWTRARAVMATDPAPGAVLVLPWHLYLGLPWNRDRPVRQPARDAFTRDAVISDRLEVGRSVVPSEDPWSALADRIVLGRSGPLAPELPAIGVRYVLVVRSLGTGSGIEQRTAGLRVVLRTPDLVLYRSEAAVAIPIFPAPPAGPVVAGDVLAVAVVLLALVALATRGRLPGLGARPLVSSAGPKSERGERTG